MAGVGHFGYFNQDPDPNFAMIPPTGAVLNEQGTPTWENSPAPLAPAWERNESGWEVPDRLHAPNTNLIGELDGIEKQLRDLIKLRSNLIERIVEERDSLNNVIEKSKKLTDDLALLDMLEEPGLKLEKDSDG